MNFQKIVIIIAIVLLILMLSFIGYGLYKNKSNRKFPPIIGECPDYWVAKKNECTNPKNLGICKGSKNFNTSKFSGDTGDCAKSKWAKNCKLTWQGITTNPDICKNK